jgi:8-oxo-dGTP pyrophosphatase MutT (NUDIX family)
MNIEAKMNDIKYTGAGIICYIDNTKGTIKELSKDYLFLILEDKKHQYDFPKGGLEPNEPILDCAKREAFEEANIKSANIEKFLVDSIDKAHICGTGLVLFLAKLDIYSIGSIKIKFNHMINDYEHKQKFFYLTKEEAITNEEETDEKIFKKMPFYLNKSLDWAYNIIKNSEI